MSRIITKGATDQTIYVEVLDSTSTTGGRKTGLVFNTASLTAYYVRNGGSATAITLATLAAANSAHSDGGFKEVDSTNMPGVYRLDLPDAAVATGADSVVVSLKGATGMAQVSAEVQLVAVNLQDSVRSGMTALPNAAAEAAGGLYTRGTGAGQINQPANGMIDANVVNWSGTAVATPDSAGYPKITIKAGTGTGELSLSSGTVTVGTNNDKTGYAIGAGGIAAAAFAAGAIDSAAIAADAIGSSELAASAANEIADALLARNIAGGSSTGRIVSEALYALRNRVAIAAGTATVYQTDDTTASWTAAVTTTAGDPISEVNPT